MKNTLFVSDLDGTLLTPDQRLSEFTLSTINALVDDGMLFTYATARSFETASAVTHGLKTSAPRVLYNGAFVCDGNGANIISHIFDRSDKAIIDDLLGAGVFPIVYSLIDGAEKFSFVADKVNDSGTEFLNTRKHCARYNPVANIGDLYKGDIFYITCIDAEQKLAPFYAKYKNYCNCIFSNDIYTGNTWLEMTPRDATKANALHELKDMLNCRLVVFGDGKNDLDMFAVADECYAVENACAALKDIATSVIGPNHGDSVAKQLKKSFYKL